MQKEARIYLDYAATTPLDDRVLKAMLPYFQQDFGNPSSIHHWGQMAENALARSREIVSETLGCSPSEVIFTGSATESNNLLLRGAAFAARRRSGANHLLTTPIDHPSVTRTVQHLENDFGFNVEFLTIDKDGLVNLEDLKNKIREETSIVSIIYANNEIGTVNNISALGAVCKSRGVLFHTDAVQAANYLSLDVDSLNVDFLTLGGHKIYGPKGVSALYIRSGTPVDPTITGGSQEFGNRASTENVPLIVGFAEALQIAISLRDDLSKKHTLLRVKLIDEVLKTIPDAGITGHRTERLPNHASFFFRNIRSMPLLAALDLAGFACSSGSACKVGTPKPSEVLLKLGFSEELSLGSLRVTIGRSTSEKEISEFSAALPSIIARLRSTH
ncbi:MAG TPA: cysteine desulfurase family protein [Anaerolineales bacterium]|nr:cysteine desulfurase family protein [Anaerolineales bacterium]